MRGRRPDRINAGAFARRQGGCDVVECLGAGGGRAIAPARGSKGMFPAAGAAA